MLQNNLNLVRSILQKAPKIGIYQGQNPSAWSNFFNYFIAFIQSQQGPRGDVIKLCRSILNKDTNYSNQILKIIGLTANSSVRDIYVSFNKYIPCEEYARYLKEQKNLQKIQKNKTNIFDQNSPMYSQISKGLRAKHGQQYDVDAKLKQLQQAYIQKFDKQKKIYDELIKALENIQTYQKYLEMSKYLKNILLQWQKVDKQIGNQSVIRGKLFQEKCLTIGLKYIYQKIGRNNFQLFVNCNWIPKNLGQVDIALAEEIQGKLKVTVLIQCKSRLFDLNHAYKQIGPSRLLMNKKILGTAKGQIEVIDNCQIFIITTLPQYDYVLPIQSALKGQLEKLSKNLTVSQLDSKKIFVQLSKKFNGEIGPLEWFNLYGQRYVIVLN